MINPSNDIEQYEKLALSTQMLSEGNASVVSEIYKIAIRDNAASKKISSKNNCTVCSK